MNTDYKAKLLEEQKTLVAELSRLGKKDGAMWEATAQGGSEIEADPNTSASRFEEFEENSAVIVPLEERLKQVVAALSKVETGKYGKCRVCNNPIEEERLAVNPAAETCMTHIEN
ncbi:MAG: TraR/DksA C4-type zinc finger protein [bacterium]